MEKRSQRVASKYRPWAGRGRALALALFLTLMLVILASAVFSIAARSREVASRSVSLHSLNESLRAATVVRSQATFAAYLAASDATFGTNSKQDIAIAVQESRRNLSSLKHAIAQAQPGGTLDSEITTELTAFTAAANRTLAVASGSRPATARAVVGEQLVPSFDALRNNLVSHRDTALSDVKEAGSLLGRLGGLASFVIAFVLPTITVLVYRQITRRSRETVEIARSLAVERGRSRRRQLLLAEALADLQVDFASIETPERGTPALRRLGWELDTLKTVVAGTGQLAFHDVNLATELPAVVTSLREVGIDVRLASAEGAVWADEGALMAAVRNLVLEAESAGALETELDAVARDDHVQLTITYDGAPLSAADAELVFSRSHDEERSAVESGAASMRLLAAQDLIEALGGSVSHGASGGQSRFIARLPRGGVLRVHAPVERTARQVAPA